MKNNLAIYKKVKKKQIKTPIKYVYADLINFSFNILENLNDHNFYSYKEKTSYK